VKRLAGTYADVIGSQIPDGEGRPERLLSSAPLDHPTESGDDDGGE
jgi:hypothetical protein